MSRIEHAHILLHDLLNALKLLFHALSILKGFRIVELSFLQLNDAIKPNKIVTSLDTFESRLQIMCPKNRFGLIKERIGQGIDKDIDQLHRVAKVDNDCKNDIRVDFVEYPKIFIFNMSQVRLLRFTVGCRLPMKVLNFHSNVLQLTITVVFSCLAEYCSITKTTYKFIIMNSYLLTRLLSSMI